MLTITRHSCCACMSLLVCARACSFCGSHRVQAADASLLVLACPDAVSFVTPSGPRLDVPAELAPLVTQNTFILLNKTDLLPTSAPVPTAALTKALQRPQHTWAVSLASHAGTGDFLAGLAKALQDRCGVDRRASNRICSDLIHMPIPSQVSRSPRCRHRGRQRAPYHARTASRPFGIRAAVPRRLPGHAWYVAIPQPHAVCAIFISRMYAPQELRTSF